MWEWSGKRYVFVFSPYRGRLISWWNQISCNCVICLTHFPQYCSFYFFKERGERWKKDFFSLHRPVHNRTSLNFVQVCNCVWCIFHKTALFIFSTNGEKCGKKEFLFDSLSYRGHLISWIIQISYSCAMLCGASSREVHFLFFQQ